MRARTFRWLAALIWLTAAAVFAADSSRTFTNPIAENGQDPWVVRWNGDYLFCQARSNRVCVNRVARLEDLGTNTWQCVWQAPTGTAWSRQIWAPELHFLAGKWYIYVAADDGDNAHHRLYVLEGSAEDPQAPFTFKGKLSAPTDRWAIDGTVLELPDKKLYFVWSGWDGTNDVAQDLYVAPMSNPWTISGERVCISRPDREWERRNRPFIDEGPQPLWHDGRLFIIYSASGAWDDFYCLGQLAWTGGDVLDPKSWVKKPDPVFAGTATVFGPGHCSFTKSPDGKEDWIVYHAHKSKGSGWQRDIRIQPFKWNANGAPDFGAPVSPGVALPAPSGE